MEKSLSDYGQVFESSVSPPSAFIIFYPPATGDQGHQYEEALEFQKLNIASLIYNPPYRRLKDTIKRGIENAQGDIFLWEMAKGEFSCILTAAKKKYGDHLKIIVIGKNLGGSVAAYAIDESVSSLIITGSVVNLSYFWTHSQNLAAVEARRGFSQEKIDAYEKATAPFDLIKTAPLLKQKNILFQFGTKDPWIEVDATEKLVKKFFPPQHTVEWVEDDHVMASNISVKNRYSYLLGELVRSSISTYFTFRTNTRFLKRL